MTTDQPNPFADPSAPESAPAVESSHPLVLILHEADPGFAEYEGEQIVHAVRRVVREELRDAFTEIAEWAGSAAQWEYDSVTSGALNRIGDMAARVTERLERRLTDGQ
jgi:hypothetical protein